MDMLTALHYILFEVKGFLKIRRLSRNNVSFKSKGECNLKKESLNIAFLGRQSVVNLVVYEI